MHDPPTLDRRVDEVTQTGRLAVPHLLRILTNTKGKGEQWWARMAAARALGLIGDERAVPPLIRALDDPDLDVQDEAQLALERFPGPAAREALETREARQRRTLSERVFFVTGIERQGCNCVATAILVTSESVPWYNLPKWRAWIIGPQSREVLCGTRSLTWMGSGHTHDGRKAGFYGYSCFEDEDPITGEDVPDEQIVTVVLDADTDRKLLLGAARNGATLAIACSACEVPPPFFLASVGDMATAEFHVTLDLAWRNWKQSPDVQASIAFRRHHAEPSAALNIPLLRRKLFNDFWAAELESCAAVTSPQPGDYLPVSVAHSGGETGGVLHLGEREGHTFHAELYLCGGPCEITAGTELVRTVRWSEDGKQRQVTASVGVIRSASLTRQT